MMLFVKISAHTHIEYEFSYIGKNRENIFQAKFQYTMVWLCTIPFIFIYLNFVLLIAISSHT